MVALNYAVKSKINQMAGYSSQFLVLRTRKSERYVSFSQQTFELRAQKVYPELQKERCRS